MEILYLISEKNIEKAQKLQKKEVIVFIETYKKIFECDFPSITSAQIAEYILNATNQKIGTNNEKKAKKIIEKTYKNTDFYLIFNDKITDNLEGKTLIIVENNEQLNKIDAQKIFCIPPWPLILEVIKTQYPNHKISAIDSYDDELFKISYHYNNIKF